MSSLRRLAPLIALAALCPLACDTHAVGISECETIERARCAAAAGCGFATDSPEARQECERYSQDNCLHGLAVSTVPPASVVNACASLIGVAGRCPNKTEPGSAAACDITLVASQASASACAVVANPDYAMSCTFLLPGPVEGPKELVDAGPD